MFKEGTKLIAKDRFLIKRDIPFEERNFTLKEYADYGIYVDYKLEGFKDGEVYIESGTDRVDFLTENFYVTNNINLELIQLLHTFEFKEFNAVTVDGKVINIR